MRSAALIIGLAALLLAGLWLTSDPGNGRSDETQTVAERPPNIIITGLNRVTTNADGEWQSTLAAEQARYFQDDDRLHLDRPTLWTRNDSDIELTAERAELRDGNQWLLQRDVRITSTGSESPPVTVRTEFLEYDTLTELAQTPEPVEIAQADRLHTTAVGMTLNFATQEFELHDQVRSLFYP